jgi:hypothetical protein
MYEIIATKDFIDVIKDLPLKHISVLSKSFVSIKEIKDTNALNTKEFDFMNDLLEQIKNQEKE